MAGVKQEDDKLRTSSTADKHNYHPQYPECILIIESVTHYCYQEDPLNSYSMWYNYNVYCVVCTNIHSVLVGNESTSYRRVMLRKTELNEPKLWEPGNKLTK